MKKTILFLKKATIRCFPFILFFEINLSTNGQIKEISDSPHTRKMIYSVSIQKMGSKKLDLGYLANLSDSNLYLSQSPLSFGSGKSNDHLSDYTFAHLEKVIIQRKGSVGRGAGYGALIGLGAGLIAGAILSSSDNNSNNSGWNIEIFSPGAEVAITGIIGAVAGALIGTITGAVAHKTFIIEGNKNKYDYMRQSFFNNLLRHHSSTNNYSTPYTPQL